MAAAGSWSVLGIAAWAGLWASQLAGYLGLVWGVGGSSPDITRTVGMILTDGGYVVLLLATVTLIALWQWGKSPRWKLLCAWLSGVSLALAGGVAGVVAVPSPAPSIWLGRSSRRRCCEHAIRPDHPRRHRHRSPQPPVRTVAPRRRLEDRRRPRPRLPHHRVDARRLPPRHPHRLVGARGRLGRNRVPHVRFVRHSPPAEDPSPTTKRLVRATGAQSWSTAERGCRSSATPANTATTPPAEEPHHALPEDHVLDELRRRNEQSQAAAKATREARPAPER